METFGAFLAASALVIVTPGQDTALTIRNTLAGGCRSGFFTVLGVVTGQLTWTLAASAGVTAVLLASATAFTALKLAGAAYLVVLGLHAVWIAVVTGRGAGRGEGEQGLRSVSPAAAYRQGLLSNLGNPKIAVFFTSLLPQFAPAAGASFFHLLALGLVFASITLAWLSTYAVVVARAGDVLRRASVQRVIGATMGAVLVTLGMRLALADR